MMYSRIAKRSIAASLAVLMTWMNAERAAATLAPVMMPSPATVSDHRAQDIRTIQSFLERKEVHQRLADFGMSDEQIRSRMANLSDQQLHQVAVRIDKQNPGADGGSVIVTVLVIGILVLLFVYLLKRV